MAVQPFVNKTPNYTAGTASVSSGSRTVTFTNANLVQTDATTGIQSSVCTVGDRFSIVGVAAAIIESIDSASQITLDVPWSGASQTNAAYKIYRYSTPAQGVVLAAANQAVTQGQDSNPDLSRAIDDGTARLKLRLKGGAASLAVGPTGTADASLVEGVDISTSGVVSFPNGVIPPADWSVNRAINGGLDIWQSGTSYTFTNTTAQYVADQWYVTPGATGAVVSKITAPSGFSGPYAINLQNTGVTVNNYSQFQQRFESQALYDLDGADITVSFDANASTSAGTLSGRVYLMCNTATDNGTFSTTLTNVSFTVPTGSGRVAVTLPGANTAGVAKGAAISIRFTQNTSTGNHNISIGAVKVEKGSVASPWSPKPIAQEWQDCMYFFQTLTVKGFSGVADTTAAILITSPLVAPMRAAPAFTASSTLAFAAASNDVYVAGVSVTNASPTIISSSATTDVIGVHIGGFSGLTIGANVLGWSTRTLGTLSARL
jgi:hypothetical protein